MFLNSLSHQDKEYFLELAHYIMGIDGIFHEEEQNIFNSYKYECQMVDYEVPKQNNVQQIIEYFKQSSDQIKRILIIELFGIALVDGKFCESEQKFFHELAEHFGIDENDLNTFHKWVTTMNQVVDVGYKLINQQNSMEK